MIFVIRSSAAVSIILPLVITDFLNSSAVIPAFLPLSLVESSEPNTTFFSHFLFSTVKLVPAIFILTLVSDALDHTPELAPPVDQVQVPSVCAHPAYIALSISCPLRSVLK